MTDDELKRLKREIDEVSALRDNLKSTQERCGVLLEENRDLKRQLANMKLRWLQLLELNNWEIGPDEETSGMDYAVKYDGKKRTFIIERDVSPPNHRCVEDRHSYGHGDECFYCGHVTKSEV